MTMVTRGTRFLCLMISRKMLDCSGGSNCPREPRRPCVIGDAIFLTTYDASVKQLATVARTVPVGKFDGGE